jgi:hypothetical protein
MRRSARTLASRVETRLDTSDCFPKAENRVEIVGRTPRSARVPLDPPIVNELSLIQTKQADEGVGCRPGGPPHDGCKLRDIAKTKAHYAGVRAPL